MGRACQATICLLACAVSLSFADERSFAVSGRVVTRENSVPPKTIQLKADMAQVYGKNTFQLPQWIGSDGALLGCVVQLVPIDTTDAESEPPRPARLQKVGPQFQPAVLAVPLGTSLEYSNLDSPCKCLNISGRRQMINQLVAAGERVSLNLEFAGAYRVQANLRPYMESWVVVTRTPYFAVTDRRGRFTVKAVPPGQYQLTCWHPQLKTFYQRSELNVQQDLTLQIP